MALHIQMSEEAEAQLRKDALRSKLTSFGAMAALIAFGGAILYFTVILIAIEQEAEFIGYTPPAENLPARAVPTTQQLSSKAATPSNTVAPSVIVATGAAPVAMAQVDIPMDDSQDDGMSIDIGMGLDAGLGDSLGDEGGGMGGSPGGSALEGTFYDLKLTKGGASTGIKLKEDGSLSDEGRAKVHKILYDFSKSWSPSVLNKYYSSPTKLYASNFFLPTCLAKYAPIAFNCQDKCKPSAWLAVYRGKVKAPKTGKFRFVGVGDETLMVRFKGKLVLEAGWCLPTMYDDKKPNACGNMGTTQAYKEAIASGREKSHKGYEFIPYPKTKDWNANVGGLTAGTVFEVKEGEVCPIEILVSEVPGGGFGFCVLIQDMSKPRKEDIEIFRTNFSMPDEAELMKQVKAAGCWRGGKEFEAPFFSQDSHIWVAVP